MSYDPENPLSELDHSDPKTQLKYFQLEPSHMPNPNYSKLPMMKLSRKLALQMIREFRTYGEGDSVVPYLALTYFDNFVGNDALHYENFVMQMIETIRDRMIIAVSCCFILASRKRNPEFCPEDFLNKQKLNHMTEIIDEIRLVVDLKLHYRKIMEPVTALCFLDYLTGLLLMDEKVRRTIKRFTTQKLHAYHTDIRNTKFLPSIVAAVAVSSSVRTFYNENALAYTISEFRKCEHIDEKNLLLALEVFFPNNYILVRNSRSTYPDFHSASVYKENLAAAMSQAVMLASNDKVMEPEKELKMTKERLEDSEKEIINLQRQLKLTEKELNAEKRDVSKSQKRIMRYQTRQSEREQEIRDLKVAVSNVEQNLFLENKKLEDQISKLIEEKARLEQNLEESNLKTQNLEEGIQKVELEKTELEKRLKCDIEQLKADVSEKGDHVKDVNKTTDALVVTTEALKLEKDELKVKVAKLQVPAPQDIPIPVTAAEEHLDGKSVTSSDSSEQYSEDSGSSADIPHWPRMFDAQPLTCYLYTFDITFGDLIFREGFILNHSGHTHNNQYYS